MRAIESTARTRPVSADGAAGVGRGALSAAIRDAIPVAGGLAPMGLAVGAGIAASPVPEAVGWATTPLLYGASAQLAAVSMLGAGAAGLTVVATLAVMSARNLFYSAALRQLLGPQPRWFRWSAPYLLVDPLFALFSAAAPRWPSAPDLRRYYLGAGLTIWAAWHGAVTAGMLLGADAPGGTALAFATPAFLLALLVPAVRDRASALAAGAAAAVAVTAAGLPGGSGLLVAIVVGTGAAALATPARRA